MGTLKFTKMHGIGNDYMEINGNLVIRLNQNADTMCQVIPL